MKKESKIALNTGILSIKLIMTMLISFVTVPIILKALGESDFGLYNLIAGIITMLSFLNLSMTVSTQRYLSVFMGRANNRIRIQQVFNTSIVLHLILGFIIIIILELAGIFLFEGFLNIPQQRISAAKLVFQVMITTTFFSIVSVPFDATMNAHEDMLQYSLLDIAQTLLRLISALILSVTTFDKLIFYCLGLMIISVVMMISKGIFCISKYPDCKFRIISMYNYRLFKEILTFSGWNTFSAFAIIGRNQGIAVILNIFFGTIVNAAYGIANQVNGVLSRFSATLQKSINPQLMKSAGECNRERMLNLTTTSSKFSVLFFSYMAIPIFIKMHLILDIWLKQYPDSTIIFCRLVLILTFVSQFSNGLSAAIQSVGRLRSYTISVCFLLCLNMPIDYLLLRSEYPAYSVFICAIGIEVLTLIVRIYFSHKLAGMSVKIFLIDVVVRTTIPIGISFCLCSLIHHIVSDGVMNILVLSFTNVVLLTVLIKLISLTDQEEKKLKSFWRSTRRYVVAT